MRLKLDAPLRFHAGQYATIAESGFPGYEATNWYAYFVPAKTPGDVVEPMNKISKIKTITCQNLGHSLTYNMMLKKQFQL